MPDESHDAVQAHTLRAAILGKAPYTGARAHELNDAPPAARCVVSQHVKVLNGSGLGWAALARTGGTGA
ncbi:MAG: hypothetical protein AAF771_01800 [Pseudomonadota bacterium]